MRSGPPEETISDVQLITSKTEQMFKCFKVNDVGKNAASRNKKPDQLILVYCKLHDKSQSTSILVSLLLYADVQAYCSHVNIYCKEVRLLSSYP